jgi:hypothetical protein
LCLTKKFELVKDLGKIIQQNFQKPCNVIIGQC